MLPLSGINLGIIRERQRRVLHQEATAAVATPWHSVLPVRGQPVRHTFQSGHREEPVSPLIEGEVDRMRVRLEDLEELDELMKSGQLNPPINLITQADIPDALDRLLKSGVVGRLVAQY